MYLEFPTKRKTSPETGNTTFSRYMAQSLSIKKMLL